MLYFDCVQCSQSLDYCNNISMQSQFGHLCRWQRASSALVWMSCSISISCLQFSSSSLMFSKSFFFSSFSCQQTMVYVVHSNLPLEASIVANYIPCRWNLVTPNFLTNQNTVFAGYNGSYIPGRPLAYIL